jgi:uncharacterized protein (TIGR03435 family)
MLRSLVTARFHIALHLESKEVQGYELTTGKEGSKLKENVAQGSHDGRPGLFVAMSAGRDGAEPSAHLTAVAQPLSALVRVLWGELNSPVADKTGLTGAYDFQLEYAPGGGSSRDSAANIPGDPVRDIAAAVQLQLGLRLERKKIALDELVIDRAEKEPTAN